MKRGEYEGGKKIELRLGKPKREQMMRRGKQQQTNKKHDRNNYRKRARNRGLEEGMGGRRTEGIHTANGQ